MDNRDFEFQPQANEEGKGKAKAFWKHVGFVVLALGLSVLTVLVLNLNR